MKKKTYRLRIIIYSLLFIAVLLSLVGGYAIANNRLIGSYHEYYEIYKNLTDFYNQQENAHNHFKNYLYTQNEEENEAYHAAMQIAGNHIDKISEKDIAAENQYRFSLLKNMLTSYDEQAEKTSLLLQMHDIEYPQAYDSLLKINESIRLTSDDFYQSVTEMMESYQKQLDQEYMIQRNIFTGMMIVCFLAIIAYAMMINKSIVSPISQLADNMENIRNGNFNLHKIKSDSKEIDVLCLALQDLSDNIDQNIRNEKEKAKMERQLLMMENENLKKDELLASSQLQILQSQVNPHFLFNSMNTIYQSAILEKSENTMSLIEKMSECMRYTMGQNAHVSTMALEINFLNNYLYIQNKRFEGRIIFELNVEDELPNIKIPSMIVEPLIDNAIKHGLANISSDGLVTINVSFDKEHIYIRVSDNGSGMDTDELEQLMMNHFRSEHSDESPGLSNLSKRLEMFYFKKAALTVTSFKDCGFDVLITLPNEKPGGM